MATLEWRRSNGDARMATLEWRRSDGDARAAPRGGDSERVGLADGDAAVAGDHFTHGEGTGA